MADSGPVPLTTADIDRIADRVVEKLKELNVVRFNKLRPQPVDNSAEYVSSSVTDADTAGYVTGELNMG